MSIGTEYVSHCGGSDRNISPGKLRFPIAHWCSLAPRFPLRDAMNCYEKFTVSRRKISSPSLYLSCTCSLYSSTFDSLAARITEPCQEDFVPPHNPSGLPALLHRRNRLN